MKENLEIKAFCIIRNNSVVTDSGIDFSLDGDFRHFSEAAYRHYQVNYPKFHKMDNLSKLGFLATEVILQRRNVTRIYKPDMIACILANSSSSLDTDVRHQLSISSREAWFPSPAVFVYTLPNVVIGEICIRHKIYGEGSFFVTEEFDAEFIADYCGNIINGGVADCCITGWVEAFDGNYDAGLFLVERTGSDDAGITYFSAGSLRSIFNRK